MRSRIRFARLARMSASTQTRRVETTSSGQTSWGRTIALIVGAWIVMAGVIVGWGWLLTHPLEDSVGATDNDVARWFADQRTSTLSELGDVGTLLGETFVELVVAPVVAVIFSAWKRSWVPGLFVLLVTAGIGGFYYVGTTLVPRNRPPVK